MEIARGRNEYPGVNVQFPAAVQFDLDKTAAHIALIAPGPTQSDVFGDRVGATGVSAALGSQPVAHIRLFDSGEWYETQVNSPRVGPVSTRSPVTK